MGSSRALAKRTCLVALPERLTAAQSASIQLEGLCWAAFSFLVSKGCSSLEVGAVAGPSLHTTSRSKCTSDK